MATTGIDKQKSDIKMVILTKNGKANQPWYSFIKLNGRPAAEIIKGMKERFEGHALANDAQVLQFYDNKTGHLIDEYKK